MKRAVGIIRVSRRGGREGESFISPGDQRKRIEEACRRDTLQLVSVAEEIDVSGGTPLDRRDGLRSAIESVEAGEAQVVVVGYFDRLFRSIAVQAEVVSRVESVGGEVLALDFGRVSEASAAQWLSGTMMGAFAEYYRRSAGERSRAALDSAVERGIVPYSEIPVGLERSGDGRLAKTEDAPLVLGAFRLRASGRTIQEAREFLAARGIVLSYRQMQGLLSNRLLIGEIRFGVRVNPEAHEAVVDRPLWERVQRVTPARGRKSKSDRLLARLGILRCGNCGSRMVVGTSHNGKYWIYRCPPQSSCTERMTISANIVEAEVVRAVKELGRERAGRASADRDAAAADQLAERAQADLDAAIRAFAGLEGESSARERLEELRAARDEAFEHADHLRGLNSALTITLEDWDHFTLDGQRAAIRALVEAVNVGPGRGVERITVVSRSE